MSSLLTFQTAKSNQEITAGCDCDFCLFTSLADSARRWADYYGRRQADSNKRWAAHWQQKIDAHRKNEASYQVKITRAVKCRAR